MNNQLECDKVILLYSEIFDAVYYLIFIRNLIKLNKLKLKVKYTFDDWPLR